MKYRVRKVEWENITFYTPQYKKRWMWRNYYKDNASAWSDYSREISFHDEDSAWNYIQNHKPWPVVSYTYGTET